MVGRTVTPPSSIGGISTIIETLFSSPTPADPAVAVQNATTQAQDAISVCARNDFRCLADALEAYATALRNLSPALPPALQKLPNIISKAAKGLRSAKSSAEAVKAIKIAVAEVHKTISLLTATDSFTLSLEKREADMVAQTLELATTKLERASGL